MAKTQVAKVEATPTIYATGKRKTSAARVFMKVGSGKVTVNGKVLKDFAQSEVGEVLAVSPFAVTETQNKYDVRATVLGGGFSAQIGAIRHAIARALSTVDDSVHRPALKKAGMLTRDARMVERKKYGRHKARKRSQFSKR